MGNMKILRTAQQGELNAVLLYKSLADAVKGQEDKELLLSIAADEGRHASELKKLTDEVLKPRNALKNLTMLSYKLFGKRMTYKIMAAGEKAASKVYLTLINEYPQLKKISADEAAHGKALTQAVKNIYS